MKRSLLAQCSALFILFILGVCVFVILSGSFYLQEHALKAGGNSRGKNIEQSYEYMQQSYPWIKEWMDSLQQHKALYDTFVTAPDGKKLHALYAPAPKTTPNTAVIVHGYTDNAVRMMHIGYLYHHDLRYNILLPDLRYSGLSEGTHLQMGWLDRKDVLLWMQVANERFSLTSSMPTQMVVHGISMGGATTLCVSGEEQSDYVKCFVNDCGFTSAWDEFEGELCKKFGLPAFPLLHTASLLTKWKYGWSFGEASAKSQTEKSKLPVLFIHGDADTFVPTWMGDSLYAAKQHGYKEYWRVPNVGHALAYKILPKEYTQKVGSFVQRFCVGNN